MVILKLLKYLSNIQINLVNHLYTESKEKLLTIK